MEHAYHALFGDGRLLSYILARKRKRAIQKSNLLSSPGCTDSDCVACKSGRGEGGPCRKSNVGCEMECALCEDVAAQTGDQDCRTTFTLEERSMHTSTARHTQTRFCGNTSKRFTTANRQCSTPELFEVSETVVK